MKNFWRKKMGANGYLHIQRLESRISSGIKSSLVRGKGRCAYYSLIVLVTWSTILFVLHSACCCSRYFTIVFFYCSTLLCCQKVGKCVDELLFLFPLVILFDHSQSLVIQPINCYRKFITQKFGPLDLLYRFGQPSHTARYWFICVMDVAHQALAT